MTLFRSLLSVGSPPPLGSVYLFKADSGVTESSNAVSEWVDSIGGLTLSQATPANQPTFVSSGLNGKPVVRFDGSNDALPLGSSQSLGNAHTICIVYKNNDWTDIQAIFTGNTSTNSLGFPNNDPITYRANNKQSSYESGVRLSNNLANNIVLVRNSTGAPSYYDNGWLVPRQANTTTSYLSGDTFSFTGIGDFSGFQLTADIAEVRIYTRALTSTEVAQWNNYVASRYGIQHITSLSKNIMCVGDSHTVTAPSLPGGYPTRLRELLDSSWNILVFGRNGRTAATVNSTIVPNSIVPKRDAARTEDIVVVFAGTNDLILSGATGTTAYNSYKAAHDALRTAGFKTVAVTMLPASTALISNQATYNTERGVFNSNVITNWATFSDALVDFTADENIGVDGASDNTTYFLDKLHLTTTGRDILVDSYIHPAILSI